MAGTRESPRLAASEDRTEAGLFEDFGDFGAFVALDFDAAVFDGAACAAGFLHLFGELFFFGEADADKVGDDGDGFAAAASGVANDVDAAAVFGGFGSLAFGAAGRDLGGAGREAFGVEGGEGVLAEGFFVGHGFAMTNDKRGE